MLRAETVVHKDQAKLILYSRYSAGGTRPTMQVSRTARLPVPIATVATIGRNGLVAVMHHSSCPPSGARDDACSDTRNGVCIGPTKSYILTQ